MANQPHSLYAHLARLRALQGPALLALLLLACGGWFLRKYFGPVNPDQLLFHLLHGGLDASDPQLRARACRWALATLLLWAGLRWLLPRLGRRTRALLWGLLGAGSAWSVGATVQGGCAPGDDGEKDFIAAHYADPARQLVQRPAPVQAPDILLVYVESLDEAFAHPRAGVPALLPRLTAWRADQAAEPGQLRNLGGASWTMGALFASLCGLPLQQVGLLRYNGFDHAERFFAGGQCLTDWLAREGWEIAFYGGASLRFAGKGKFLAAHGVARRLGREDWLARGLEVPEQGWGLPDSQLGPQVAQDLARPRRDGRPRMSIVLTVDTHSPHGTLDPGCAAALAADAEDGDADAVMRAALRCSDRVVAELVRGFVGRADGRPKLVWVMGDHLGPLPLLGAELEAGPQAPRRVFHALARYDGQGRPLPAPAGARAFSHLDLLPTLAEAAGLRWAPDRHRLGLGVSLLAPRTAAGPTLLEREGFERLDARLACTSPLFERLWRGASEPGG